MNDSFSQRSDSYRILSTIGRFAWNFLLLSVLFFFIELLAFHLLAPEDTSGLIFGGLWSMLLSALILLLPRRISRIAFAIVYFISLIWALAQCGYYEVFQKMMWLSGILYAGEGAAFLGDVITGFPPLWWFAGFFLIAIGVMAVWKFPKSAGKLPVRLPYLCIATASIVGLFLYPEVIFQRDNDIWGTHSEYAQSSSYRAAYNTMYDAKRVYDICGIYHLTAKDFWKNELYPLTPAYLVQQKQTIGEINTYFSQRPEAKANSMTGIFQGKNVVMVLMESMDDWMITPEDTPTIHALMNEGIQFSNFYTPGYGSARTLNSEFCVNTGIYLPTTGSYVFDYVTNSFRQSIASQMTETGYSAEVFHYNDPDFYSRGVFEPAMGYDIYNCYGDYTDNEDDLFNENLLFDIQPIKDRFFRDGQTFNTIITRSAHLSYVYNEVLSYHSLKKYPEYRGMYGSEEEDCARLKAKIVDDMFARLLQELDANGQLDNTVIIGVTDHYTYGYKNEEELFAHSGVTDALLLEKTPCFIWAADCPDIDVSKVLNTSDFLPTVLNLMGIDSPYHYLGQDAFDPQYKGYAFFPDGSWIYDGIACEVDSSGEYKILFNEQNKAITEELILEMSQQVHEYIHISNLLLTSNYYNKIY